MHMVGRYKIAFGGDTTGGAKKRVIRAAPGKSSMRAGRFICRLYSDAVRAPSKIYAARPSSCRPQAAAHGWRVLRRAHRPRPGTTLERTIAMLDVIYLLVGAGFLGLCVLYAHACDHL
jgi:hypothetical protein